MTPINASEVKTPGAYTWVDAKGVGHVGQVTQDLRGRLSGSFIAADGSVRAAVFEGPGVAQGLFCGPLDLPMAPRVARQGMDKHISLPGGCGINKI